MATLTAGQSATIGLDAWATLTLVVSGSATISFTSQAPSVHPSFNVTTATSRSYGPFGCPMSAVVRAVDRGVTYTIEGGVGGFSRDTSGNVTGLVGPDGTIGGFAMDRAAGQSRNRLLKRFLDTVGVGAVNSGTAATVSIDASSPFGRPAYKVAMPSGNTYHEVTLTGRNIANFDGHVIWRVWVEDYTAVAQIVAYAGTSGYSRLYQQTHNISNSNKHRYNGEHVVRVGALAAATTNTFVGGTDTLADMKLRITPGASGANVWVDAVFVPGVGRPTHILTFDDCSVTWIDNVLPYLSAVGLTGTFGVNSGDIDGSASLYLSSAQVLQIADAGHQISSHNVSNTAYSDGTGGTQSAADYTADFVTGCAALSAIVGQRLDASYHPWVQGRTNTDVMDTMRAAGLMIARGTDEGYNWPQVGLGNGVLQLRNQALHTKSTADITTICTNARTYGATVVWMVHEVTAAGGAGVETSVATFRHLVDCVAADVSAGLAISRTMAQFGREVYAERLVAASLL